ncbi:alanine racemase [Microbacterium resistens]|uniref:Alanine racemase n=1 Tax=Microbacterium resistens TaxID=156977 RepID=A0ABU1S951_9MICO|nr:alanine racemase C-terminal domain-containing protein [Microbacterium resistens]MDR6866147.1 alanine racemase [Microbacterium resistens]
MSELSRSATLRTLISRSALALGAARAVAAGGRGVADLRRDAWGHGLLGVAQAVSAAGARAVRVDDPAEVDALAFEGIVATVGEEPDLDPMLLYGLPDSAGVLPGDPVMRAVGRVLSTKAIEAGGGVSYGYAYRAERDSRLALVSGGYAQGIVRALGNRASVEIGGLRHPIVGRIAMDVCVIDIGEAAVEIGDEATYFGGRGPVAAALSEWTGPTGMSVPELVAVVGQKTERAWES